MSFATVTVMTSSTNAMYEHIHFYGVFVKYRSALYVFNHFN